MMPPHSYRSRSSFSGAPSPMTLKTVMHYHRHIAMLVACRLNHLSLPRFAAPAAPAMPATATKHTTAPHVPLQPPPGLEKCARQHASHGIPVKAAPVRPRLCKIYLSHAPAATCLHHPSGNTSCALSCYPQEKCKCCLCGNAQSCWCTAGTDPFPNPVGALQELIPFLNHATFFFARTQGEERSVQRVTHANNACRLSQQPRPHGIPP